MNKEKKLEAHIFIFTLRGQQISIYVSERKQIARHKQARRVAGKHLFRYERQ